MRELKPAVSDNLTTKVLSHPSRVRELKRMPQRRFVGNHPSHPSRVRELKLSGEGEMLKADAVAPLPGA